LNYTILGPEPSDHAIGRSQGGLTCRIHVVADGRGRPLSMVLTPGNVNDTTMMAATIERIRCPETAWADTGPGPSGYWRTRATPRRRTGPTCQARDQDHNP
jgi:hypothetical protein